MKIILAYEGGAAGGAALADLSRAGLPNEGEAVVLSVADVWLPGPDLSMEKTLQTVPGAAQTRVRAQRALREAQATSRRGAERLRRIFPGWRVSSEAVADSPAWAIFKKARDSGASLVVVGQRTGARWKRWTQASVSEKVLAESPVSVRVSRAPGHIPGSAPKLMVAVDGSANAERAVQQILARSWAPSTAVRVVAVADERLTVAPLHSPEMGRWTRPMDRDPKAWIGRMVESIEERFVDRGLSVSGRVLEGDPRKILVTHASRWGADSIFLGARGLSRWERMILGRVSAWVAAHATCSVEVVR